MFDVHGDACSLARWSEWLLWMLRELAFLLERVAASNVMHGV